MHTISVSCICQFVRYIELRAIVLCAATTARADEGFHSLQLSVDRVYSFDFADESAKMESMNGIVSATNGATKSMTSVDDRAYLHQTTDHEVTAADRGAGFPTVLSGSSEFTPASYMISDATPSSVNYSADDYGSRAYIGHNVNVGTATAGAAAENAPIRMLGSVHGGFKTSTPFLTSFGPQDSVTITHGHAKTSSFKPAPIKIPNHLGSSSNFGSPLYVHKDYTSQAHTSRSLTTQVPIEANNMVADQVQSLDLSFVSLFTESKQEILKLLRDDKFPRFKSTQEFNQFISTVKPYEHNAMAGKHGNSFHNMDHSLSARGIE